MVSTLILLLIQTGITANMPEKALIITTPATAEIFQKEWSRYPEQLDTTFETSPEGPVISLNVEKQQETKAAWNRVYKIVPTKPGQRFEAAVTAEGDTSGGNGPTVTLSFLDNAGKRMVHTDMFLGSGVTGKRQVKLWAQAPDKAVAVQLSLLLHGFGEVHYTDAMVRRLEDVEAPPGEEDVVLSVTNQLTTALIGAGFEDDGWFYNAGNAAQGVGEEDLKLREARIEWMEPDYVRMFFWYNDWNPSLDGKTFTWDSDNMKSHYRTLDLYQRLGTRVNVCGVEWGVKDPWENPEHLAHTIGALLEHLIVEKGYSCIRDYTLTNEPDIFFARSVERKAQSFDTFVKLHQCVRDEFNRRGLNLNIVGSDDGNNRTWFERCVNDDTYFELSDLFASHFYFSLNVVPLAGHILKDRVALLQAKTPAKKFIIGELGFADERMKPPANNPLMREYPYALLAMSTFMDALNAGVSGWSIWCVHEMYYPGGKTPMHFGLWDFDPPSWTIRPIYHALALITRNTKAGDMVFCCNSSHPDWVKGARVGDKIFWVNLGETATRIRITGAMRLRKVISMTEEALTHDRDCAQPLTIDGNQSFSASAKSFGMGVVTLQK